MSDSIKETVAKLKKISEGHLGAMADRVELDHEVQLARGQLYKIAKYAIKLHEAFKDVSEVQGLDGWVSAKITEASLAMDDVAHYMEYELSPANVVNEGKVINKSGKWSYEQGGTVKHNGKTVGSVEYDSDQDGWWFHEKGKGDKFLDDYKDLYKHFAKLKGIKEEAVNEGKVVNKSGKWSYEHGGTVKYNGKPVGSVEYDRDKDGWWVHEKGKRDKFLDRTIGAHADYKDFYKRFAKLKGIKEEEGTTADLLHEYNVLEEAEQVDFNLANLAPELRPAVRKALVRFPDAVDPLSAVVRMLQQDIKKHGEYEQGIDRLGTENDEQDVDIDSTDIDLGNLVARVDKLEQPQVEPQLDRRPDEEDEITTPESKYSDWSK
jgi:hypothetical protein